MKKIPSGYHPITVLVDEFKESKTDPVFIITQGADIKGGVIRFVNTYNLYCEDPYEKNTMHNILADIVYIVEKNAPVKKRTINDISQSFCNYAPINKRCRKLIQGYLNERWPSIDVRGILNDFINENADGILYPDL